jgi:thioredoxin 1
MDKNKGVIIGVVAIVVIFGGSYMAMNRNDSTAMMEKEKLEQEVMTEEKEVIEGNLMMEKGAMEESEVMMKDDVVSDGEAMIEDEAMKNAEVMTAKKETSVMDTTEVMTKPGVYKMYAPEVIANAATEDIVLFFKADWCPTCRAADADIKANLSNIPGDLTILEVNYDNSKELKKKYGVTYQHTFVQVDAQGTMLKKWGGSGTLAALVKEVQ